jgi:hypothetical protein
MTLFQLLWVLSRATLRLADAIASFQLKQHAPVETGFNTGNFYSNGLRQTAETTSRRSGVL